MAFKSGNFQRSQSKVWWGNYPERDEYGFVALPKATPPPPPPTTTAATTKSSKLTPPEIATTSWSYRRGSPGSFKSHDSGFSDSDQSPPNSNAAGSDLNTSGSSNASSHHQPSPNTPKRAALRLIGTASATSGSVSSSSTEERRTPPTVIRKKPAETAALTHALCRRISFSAPSSPIYERIDDADLISQIDSLQYANTSPASARRDCTLESSIEEDAGDATTKRPERKFHSLKRSKVIRRQTSKTAAERTLLRCVSQISIESMDDFYQQAVNTEQRVPTHAPATLDEPSVMMQTAIPQTPRSILKSDRPAYANETVTFGVVLNESQTDSNTSSIQHILPTYAELYPSQTSTPKATAGPTANQSRLSPAHFISNNTLVELAPTAEWDDCTYYVYENPLLNGHSSSIQCWLDDTRRQYCHEVLATLQTKSIAAQAARYADLNSAMAGRLIRQLQERAHRLQADFEYVERLLVDAVDDDALLKELPEQVRVLHINVLQSTQRMSAPAVFAGKSAASAANSVRFRNNCACIADMSYDLVRLTGANDLSEIDPRAVLEDVRLLKRYVLITVRMVFEQLVRVIIDRCETVRCDLIMRSNLTLLAQLSNAAYAGLASLNEAFVATRAPRVLLAIADETTAPAVRVLAMRALTTICCTGETIRQFEVCGGLEIVADILCDSGSTEPESREAVSVFAQITAEWHGPEHRLIGLRPLVEQLVGGLTRLAEQRECCQTLLLAVAALSNMARMEPTAIYSLMSNDTVLRLRAASERRGPAASVFLYVSDNSQLHS